MTGLRENLQCGGIFVHHRGKKKCSVSLIQRSLACWWVIFFRIEVKAPKNITNHYSKREKKKEQRKQRNQLGVFSATFKIRSFQDIFIASSVRKVYICVFFSLSVFFASDTFSLPNLSFLCFFPLRSNRSVCFVHPFSPALFAFPHLRNIYEGLRTLLFFNHRRNVFVVNRQPRNMRKKISSFRII